MTLVNVRCRPGRVAKDCRDEHFLREQRILLPRVNVNGKILLAELELS